MLLLMDVSRIESMGWKATIDLKEGLQRTYEWFLENQAILRC